MENINISVSTIFTFAKVVGEHMKTLTQSNKVYSENLGKFPGKLIHWRLVVVKY